MQAKSIAKRSTVTIKLGEQVSQYERARPGDFVIVVRGGRVFFYRGASKMASAIGGVSKQKIQDFQTSLGDSVL